MDYAKVGVRIALPLMGTVACLFVFLFGEHIPCDWLQVTVPMGLLSFPLQIKGSISLRIVSVLLAVGCIYFYALRDYSVFYPKRLRVTGYFDLEGTAEAVRSLLRVDSNIAICEHWQKRRQEVLAQIDERLHELLPYTRFSLLPDDYSSLSTTGEVHLDFERITGRWQLYAVTESSEGFLTHTLHLSTGDSVILNTKVKAAPQAPNEVSIAQAFWRFRFRVVLQPRYQQIVTDQSGSSKLLATITAATPIRLFPFLDIGRTIYFIEDNGGCVVPIGYARYDPDVI